ncbi:hypothetical protein ONS96_000107 [Cadophora gregata f. sp. sojae]|nr:hypothetical protein ONS96_000107 [Cadophora gregata f. sp. sojae]
MTYIRVNTNIPVPEVYGYDVSPSNAFGFRYVLMEMLPGRIIDHDSKNSIPTKKWAALADQLAEYMYQLSKLRFSTIGRLLGADKTHLEEYISPIGGGEPVTTSLEYFYTHRQNHTQLIKSDHEGDDDWATAAWILEQAVPAMVVPEFSHGPFPLCHVDLHFEHILVDADLNITGIIDWSKVQTVPVERFTVMPEIAMFLGASHEVTTRIGNFRQALKDGLRKREIKGRRDVEMPLISDLIGTPRWEIIYSCHYSHHSRALTDVRLVMQQIYGSRARFRDFVEFYRNAPIHTE